MSIFVYSYTVNIIDNHLTYGTHGTGGTGGTGGMGGTGWHGWNGTGTAFKPSNSPIERNLHECSTIYLLTIYGRFRGICGACNS